MLSLFPMGRVYAQDTCGNKTSFDTTYHNYFYDQRVAYFRQLPVVTGGTMFIGNSITQGGDWAELLGNGAVQNRGISGDISYGILARLNDVVRQSPKRVFIMIGVNDIGRGIPLELTLANYRNIIKRLKDLREVKIYVQSVLPINPELINRKYFTGTNAQIRTMNDSIRDLCKEQHVDYIDLYSVLGNAKGEMPAEYTYDGLHLSGKGYLKWVRYLKDQHYIMN